MPDLVELGRRLRDSDESALQECMDLWEDDVRRFIAGRGLPDVAEDLTQETFARLWCFRHGIIPETFGPTYVKKIAENLCNEQFKTVSVKPLRAPDGTRRARWLDGKTHDLWLTTPDGGRPTNLEQILESVTVGKLIDIVEAPHYAKARLDDGRDLSHGEIVADDTVVFLTWRRGPPPANVDLDTHDPPDSSPSIEDRLVESKEGDEARVRLSSHLGALRREHPKWFEALVLREVDGKSGQDVARVMGTNEDTVATWKRRACLYLRLRAKEQGLQP